MKTISSKLRKNSGFDEIGMGFIFEKQDRDRDPERIFFGIGVGTGSGSGQKNSIPPDPSSRSWEPGTYINHLWKDNKRLCEHSIAFKNG
jgi:hypothetical protein